MTTATAQRLDGWSWDYVLQAWQDLDVPEGWRAEITEWGIRMTPPPGGPHNDIACLVNKALVRGIPDEWGIHQTQGIKVGHLGQMYIPDIVVVPRGIERIEDDQFFAAEDTLLAIEITSRSHPSHDRKAKLQGYAHGPVPLYLLIDRVDPVGQRCTLYSEPSGGEYLRSVTSPFGEPVELPAPFDLTLDTSRFR